MATTVRDDEQGRGTAGVARILLVEDDAAIARATMRLLRRLDRAVEVVHMYTGEAAIVALGSAQLGPFDLVVSDYNLDGFATGADVLAAVRMLSPQPKFLFVSSDERIQVLGQPYIEKPARLSELRELILKLLDDELPKVVREQPLDGRFDIGGCP